MDYGKCFRPLTGTLLSKCSILNSQLPLMRVSVPSRGLSYLNEVGKVYGEDAVKCFRPLTGTLLSKYSLSKSLAARRKQVSVPSRGLSYLNPIRQFSLPKRLLPLVCVANDILMIKEFNVFI